MIRLSPTTGLGLFRECPKCFWIHYNKNVKRPQSIFPSLPGGMDLKIKDYFDKYRDSMPPEIKGKVPGKLVPDKDLLDKWRNWRVGLSYFDKKRDAQLSGALDDCLLVNNKYIPLDYKTRGFAPKEGQSEQYYQTQLDVYSFLLSENGYKTGDFAYLIYYYPEKVSKNGLVYFNVEPVKVSTDLKRAKKLFEDAVDFLKGPEPAEHTSCLYCDWLSARNEFD